MLLKKFVAIFFLLIYGFTSVGATVHIHYCMGKYVGASLWQSKNEKCGKCGMVEKNKKGCCKDEHKQIKLSTDHQKAFTAFNYNTLISPAIVSDFIKVTFPQKQINALLPKVNAPPPKQAIPIYILNCIFRI